MRENEPSGTAARTRWVIVVGVAVVVGMVGLALLWATGRAPSASSEAPAGTGAPLAGTAPGGSEVEPPPVVGADGPPSETIPADPLHQPGSAAAAHAAIAAELGLVAIRCRLPPGVPTRPPVGPFRPRVVDGWLSDIVFWREGERPAQFPVEPPPGSPDGEGEGFETAYYVSWQAQRLGESVRCVIRPVERGTLVVTLVDADGAPVDGVEIQACGRSGTTEEGHLELYDVTAGEPCTVRATRVGGDGVCTVREAVTVPPGGLATVEVALRCDALSTLRAIDVLRADFEEIREAVRPEADHTLDEAAEIALFQRLRADVDPNSEAAALYDELVGHREERLAGKAAREELLQRLRSGDPTIRAQAIEIARRLRP